VKLLRTIPGFVRLLVGLFLVAQFAGVVSSPRASALPMAAAHASQGQDHHRQDLGDQGKHRGHHDHANPADACCALHAYFAGVLPQVVAIATQGLTSQSLSVSPDDLVLGVPSGRLDRPPRPLH
jgi:hypothetical protein